MSLKFALTLLAYLLACGSAGCQSAMPQRNIEIARTYREHLSAERFDHARAMLTDDARVWFGSRKGEGRPMAPGAGTGPWAIWDEHFQSSSEPVEWSAAPGSATVIIRETNDYYQLLERGPQLNSLTYFINEDGRIDGLVIASHGPRPMGRTDDFLAWARAHAPDELAELMPNGEIDPRGDHPQRFRALLNRWRIESGRKPIDAPQHQ